MIVEYISVGTEILLGNIINTNAAFLAEQFAKLGLTAYYQTSVGDNKARINECLDIAIQRSDIIVISGGMGPSSEDVTKDQDFAEGRFGRNRGGRCDCVKIFLQL